MTTIGEIRQDMINAENEGRVYNATFGEHSEPGICWMGRDYIIVYVTDDETLDATMLTEDIMDEMTIEER